MRSWKNREELVHRTVMLHADGLSRRAIARALGVSRNTIKKILIGHAKQRQDPHSAIEKEPERAPREKKTDDYLGQVKQLLGAYSDITAQRVFEEVCKSGYEGGYTAIKELVRTLRPKPKPTPSLQTPSWGPGKMAESDWSAYPPVSG